MEQVPEDGEGGAAARLQALISKQQAAFNARMRGLTIDVLFEKPGKHPGQIVGRSPWLQAVQADAPPRLIGTIAPVTIEAVGANSLFGALKDATDARKGDRLNLARGGSVSRVDKRGDGGRCGRARRGRRAADRSRLREQPPRLRALRRVRPEPRADRAAAQDRRAGARQHGDALRPAAQLALARRVLESLYDRLLEGYDVLQGDVEGAIRMAEAEEAQLPLPTLDGPGRMQLARIATRKKSVVARTPMQDAYIRAMDRSELVFGIGPAGTGKTYLAVAFAAAMLERGDVERIILSRPAVEAGERLGFLPGDMKEKVDPYLRPLYDALYDMMPADRVERGFASGIIEVAPLAFMRGRTLSRAAIILDEAQNATSMQMKMFLTRLGEDSKMIVTGDPTQSDLRPGEISGLYEATRILDGVDGVAIVRFTGADVVRHPLVQRIVDAYERDEREETDLGG